MWPDEVEQLRAYGNEKVSFAADHFASILECDKDELLQRVARVEAVHLGQHEGAAALWHLGKGPRPLQRALPEYRPTDHHPSCAAILECVGRAMFLDDEENQDGLASLSQHVDTLIRIKKMGPPVDVFAPTKAVDVFFGRKPRRTGVQPYGPRQRDDGDGSEHVAKNARVE